MSYTRLFDSLDSEKIADKTKDEKTEMKLLLSPLRKFKKKAVSTVFDLLPDAADIISPLLTIKDMNCLISTSQNIHQLFHRPLSEARLNQLLQFVIDGKFDKVKEILDHYSLLLLYKGKVMGYTYQEYYGTAYQIALGSGDVRMAKMIQNYLMYLPEGGLSVVLEQEKEQFPLGLKDQKQEDSSPDIQALLEITQTILEADNSEVQTDDNCHLTIISKRCNEALDAFRKSIFPKENSIISNGKYFNIALFSQAIELWRRHFVDFGGQDQSPKNILFCCQVIGAVQRLFPAWLAMASCVDNPLIDNKLSRSLEFQHYSTYNPSFYPLDTKPDYRLGYHWFVAGARTNGYMGPSWGMATKLFEFVDFILKENNTLTEIMQTSQSKRMCAVM